MPDTQKKRQAQNRDLEREREKKRRENSIEEAKKKHERKITSIFSLEDYESSKNKASLQ